MAVIQMTTPWESECLVVTLHRDVMVTCLPQVAYTTVCTHAMETTNRLPLSTLNEGTASSLHYSMYSHYGDYQQTAFIYVK